MQGYWASSRKTAGFLWKSGALALFHCAAVIVRIGVSISSWGDGVKSDIRTRPDHKEAALSSKGFPIKPVVVVCVTAAALTYFSLLVPGRVSAVCSNLGTPVYCPVIAYGFPLPFVADSRTTSPVGSVGRDPLSLLTGLDDVLWPQLTLTTLFWLLAVLLGRLAWSRMGRSNVP